MGLLRYDNPVIEYVGKAVDMFFLNVMCFLLCIPVVTAGAAITAKYDVAMRILRKEEPVVWQAYFKAFRKNFKLSTLVWLTELALGAFLFYDWKLIMALNGTELTVIFRILLFVLCAFLVLVCMSAFPLIARFEIGYVGVLKNAVFFTIVFCPKMLLVVLWYAFPVVACYHFMQWLPLVLFVCTCIGLYFNAKIYMKAFAVLEEGRLAAENPTEEVELVQAEEIAGGEQA